MQQRNGNKKKKTTVLFFLIFFCSSHEQQNFLSEFFAVHPQCRITGVRVSYFFRSRVLFFSLAVADCEFHRNDRKQIDELESPLNFVRSIIIDRVRSMFSSCLAMSLIAGSRDAPDECV